jgi:hypothetical protein
MRLQKGFELGPADKALILGSIALIILIAVAFSFFSGHRLSDPESCPEGFFWDGERCKEMQVVHSYVGLKRFNMERTIVHRDVLEPELLRRELQTQNPQSVGSLYQAYVTPQNSEVVGLANGLSTPRQAYEESAGWLWVPERDLHGIIERWQYPDEFLANSTKYSTNPMMGTPAGDCEEQANTLVSILRAMGTPPENVRVAMGEATFGDHAGGHVWVEILDGGRWLALDPSSGSYVDSSGEVVLSKGIDYDYFRNRNFPVVELWEYYNDVYYLKFDDMSGNAPRGWL